jgi:excisionase family DNA binding protein
MTWLCRSCIGDGEVWRSPENGAICGRCGLLAMVPKASPATAAVRRDQPEPLWTTAEAAKHLGVSTSWVGQASREGKLPTVHVGSRLRFRPEVIRSMLDRPEGLPSVGGSRRKGSA